MWYDQFNDPTKSTIVGNVGTTLPSANSETGINVSAMCCHGAGISTAGCKTADQKNAAARYIAWLTSKNMEMARIHSGYGLYISRTTSYNSPDLAAVYPADFIKTQNGCIPLQKLCIPQIPQWPQIGDYLGIKLEELFTAAFAGTTISTSTIKASLDDAVSYAQKAITTTS